MLCGMASLWIALIWLVGAGPNTRASAPREPPPRPGARGIAPCRFAPGSYCDEASRPTPPTPCSPRATMDYRPDLYDACREADRDTIRIQARVIDRLKIRCAAAEASVSHLLEGLEADRAEVVVAGLEAVRRVAEEAERARLGREGPRWRT